MKRYKESIDKENLVEAKRVADEIINNTYRTLLSRGQKGCYIYCTDMKLKRFLKMNVNINGGKNVKEYR